MTTDELVMFRYKWELTQENLARRLGMGRRAYIDLEMGRRPIRRLHILALERVSMDMSIIHNDPSMLMPSAKYVIDYLASNKE